jgi:ribonuclease P protein component
VPGPFRFPRQARLLHRREFDAVFRHGRKLVGPAFICYVARGDEAGCKLGLAVSRKVGGAVIRNRIKRFVREFFRTQNRQLPPGIRMVVVARPPAGRMRSAAECADALRPMLEGGGMWDE